MKKLKCLILLLCISIILIGCTKKEAERAPESTSTPLLLEVTKEGMDFHVTPQFIICAYIYLVLFMLEKK